jgi:hypothetical protein
MGAPIQDLEMFQQNVSADDSFSVEFENFMYYFPFKKTPKMKVFPTPYYLSFSK